MRPAAKPWRAFQLIRVALLPVIYHILKQGADPGRAAFHNRELARGKTKHAPPSGGCKDVKEGMRRAMASPFTVIIIGLLVEVVNFRTVENHTVRRWGMQS